MSPESEAAAADRARQLKEAIELSNSLAGCKQRISDFEQQIEFLLDVKQLDFSLGQGAMHVHGRQIEGPYKVNFSSGMPRRSYTSDEAFQAGQYAPIQEHAAICVLAVIDELRAKITAEEDSIIILVSPEAKEDE